MADKEEKVESSSDDSEFEDMSEEEDEQAKVYLPNLPMEEGEELVCDKSAYLLYHQASAGAPCLSFDIIPADGKIDDQYPATVCAVGGSQAESSRGNHVIAFKMSNLHGMKKKDDDESSSDEDSSDDEMDQDQRPIFESAMRQHRGGINRIRFARHQGRPLASTWSEHGAVHVWDLSAQTKALKSSAAMGKYKQDKQQKVAEPLFSFNGFMTEGFAMDWSSLKPGSLLTGDCKNNIFLFDPTESGWSISQVPFSGHEGSVEEVLWSPNEATVFASCSVDASIRFWDTRSKTKKHQVLVEKAHTSDVNVMSWNKDAFLLSGGDDGMIKVWDLRQLKQPMVTYKHHTGPITSVEWNPNDQSVFAAAGADDQISIWDLGVEKDETAPSNGGGDVNEVPPQLLFIHQGQKDIKELHWHPQYPGMIVSTAADGFNVFRTVSV